MGSVWTLSWWWKIKAIKTWYHLADDVVEISSLEIIIHHLEDLETCMVSFKGLKA